MARKKNVYKAPSIRLRSDGRYEARIYVGVNPNTKPTITGLFMEKPKKKLLKNQENYLSKKAIT